MPVIYRVEERFPAEGLSLSPQDPFHTAGRIMNETHYKGSGEVVKFFIDFNKTQEEVNREPAMTAVEALAVATSRMEDRLEFIERTFGIRPYKRCVRIEEQENASTAQKPSKPQKSKDGELKTRIRDNSELEEPPEDGEGDFIYELYGFGDRGAKGYVSFETLLGQEEHNVKLSNGVSVPAKVKHTADHTLNNIRIDGSVGFDNVTLHFGEFGHIHLHREEFEKFAEGIAWVHKQMVEKGFWNEKQEK